MTETTKTAFSQKSGTSQVPLSKIRLVFDALIYVQLWKTWLFYLCVRFLSVLAHYSLHFQPGNEEVTKLNRNLNREQLVLHSLLNLFQSFNAEWLLITVWGCGGRPQSAASGDTLTLCCITNLLQLLLPWKPRRRRWLVSGLLLFIILSAVQQLPCS